MVPTTPEQPLDLSNPPNEPPPLAPHVEAYRTVDPSEDVFRRKHRELTDFEKRVIEELKARAWFLHVHLKAHFPDSRDTDYALAQLEGTVLWATKAISA